MRVLAAKDTAKVAMGTIKTLRMGSEHVREAKAQVCGQEFEDLRFKDGESVEDSVLCLTLTCMVADLELYGDRVTEHKAIQKFLQVVSPKYRKSLIDLKMMTIKELVGRFSACEDHYDLDDASQSAGRLLLTAVEWAVHQYQFGGRFFLGREMETQRPETAVQLDRVARLERKRANAITTGKLGIGRRIADLGSKMKSSRARSSKPTSSAATSMIKDCVWPWSPTWSPLRSPLPSGLPQRTES